MGVPSVRARMKAMVLAAGLGTRLKPITFEIPKPMVPVLDRPVMAHIVGMLERQGFDELIANLHYYPDTIRDYFGDRLEYRFEEELLGTAGGVRNVADFFGDEEVVVVSGDALTDLDINALVERHRSAGGIATLTVKKVPDTREYGVVIHDADGRIQGFQEKPEPAEALSDLGNCGIYCFSPEIFDYFPAGAVRRLGAGRVPRAARERRALPRARDRRLLERRRLARGAAPGHLGRAGGQAADRGHRRRRSEPRRRRGGRRDRLGRAPTWSSARACG